MSVLTMPERTTRTRKGVGRRHRHLTLWERAVAYLMMLPALVPYGVFAIAPMIWLLRYSFYDWNGFTSPRFIGLDNYRRVLQDPVWWAAVGRTLEYGAGRLVIEIPLSLMLAWAIYRGIRGGSVFRTIFLLPHTISPAIVGIIFGFLLKQADGPVNGVLHSVGVVATPIDFLGTGIDAMLSLIGVGAWFHFGINTLLFLAGMSTISTSTLESARLDGANGLQTFWHIVLPQLRPVTRIVVLVYIVGVLRSFDLIKTLTNGGPAGQTDVMFTYIYGLFFSPQTVPQVGYAAALGVFASLIVAAGGLLYLALFRKRAS